MRRLFIVSIAMALLFHPTGALAAKRYQTGVTIKYTDSSRKLSGKLSSAEKKCVSNRQGWLYKSVDGDWETVGAVGSRKSGKWRTAYGVGRGRYYVTFSETERKVNGDKVTCATGKSRKISVY